MATYLTYVQLLPADSHAYQLLKSRMQNENFTSLAKTDADQKTFSYYGNQDLLRINETIKRAAMATGKNFSYTKLKDKQMEKQYHAAGNNA